MTYSNVMLTLIERYGEMISITIYFYNVMITVLKRCEFTILDVLFLNVMITLIKRCDEKGYFF